MNVRVDRPLTSRGANTDAWAAEVQVGEARSRRPEILFLFGTGMAVGLHLALVHLFIWRSIGGFVFFMAATFIYCAVTLQLWKWVMPHFSIYEFRKRLALQLIASVVTYGVLSFLTVEAHALLLGGSSILWPYEGLARTITISSESIRRAPIIYALMPILPTAVLCIAGFNLHWTRIAMLHARERELRDLAISAQLAALRAQVNPHFFFNSLNSIAQLISTDPEKAEACVERLADIFRYMLTRSQVEFVPVDDELELAQAYLEIERARFGDELVVHATIEDAARSRMVPGLILQPLVENAVRHGISQKIGGGEVFISAAVSNGELQLVVRDTGVGIKEKETVFERGVGLRSVRDRLVRLYGPTYKPTLESADGEGTTVSLRIPAQPHTKMAGALA